MGAFLLVRPVEGHSTGLQREIQPHDDESREAAAGPAGASIPNCDECLQLSNFVNSRQCNNRTGFRVRGNRVLYLPPFVKRICSGLPLRQVTRPHFRPNITAGTATIKPYPGQKFRSMHYGLDLPLIKGGRATTQSECGWKRTMKAHRR